MSKDNTTSAAKSAVRVADEALMIPEWVLTLRGKGGLSAGDVLVYGALLWIRESTVVAGGRALWWAVTTPRNVLRIAKMIEVSPRTVKRSLVRLCTLALLKQDGETHVFLGHRADPTVGERGVQVLDIGDRWDRDSLYLPMPIARHPGLTSGAKLIYAVVYRYESMRDGTCHAELTTMAERAHVHLSRLKEQLRELTAAGLIATVEERRHLRQSSVRACLVDKSGLSPGQKQAVESGQKQAVEIGQKQAVELDKSGPSFKSPSEEPLSGSPLKDPLLILPVVASLDRHDGLADSLSAHPRPEPRSKIPPTAEVGSAVGCAEVDLVIDAYREALRGPDGRLVEPECLARLDVDRLRGLVVTRGADAVIASVRERIELATLTTYPHHLAAANARDLNYIALSLLVEAVNDQAAE